MTTGRIPVVVVAGYLGAGKTTLINKVLAGSSEPIAVVVNDFGSVNIDATLIKSRHGDTIELTNGCICCVIGGSLAEVLFDIDARKERPTAVLIEASGVADPASVASYAHLGGFRLAGTVVLVDAQNAMETNSDRLVNATFQRQVRCADLVLVTKVDAVAADDDRAVRELVASINPGTPIIDVGSVEVSDLFDVGTPNMIPVTNAPHAHFTSTVVDIGPRATRLALSSLLDSLPDRTVRVKGIVELVDEGRVLVQRVGRHTSVTATDLAPTGLVTIAVD